MQFDAGFQSLKENVDSKHKKPALRRQQRLEDGFLQGRCPRRGNRYRGVSEALTYHSAHTDEHTPQCESSMRKMGGLLEILKVRRSGNCHKRRMSVD